MATRSVARVQKPNPSRAASGRTRATVLCRDYVCEHGISQSTCKCVGVEKEKIVISCRTDCPGREPVKGRKRGK